MALQSLGRAGLALSNVFLQEIGPLRVLSVFFEEVAQARGLLTFMVPLPLKGLS